MQVVRRFAGGDRGTVVDAGIAIAGAGLTAFAAWDPAGVVGAKAAGPLWLLALLPLVMGVAMALRRRAPLLMLLAISAGIALQCLVTRHPPQVLELLVLFAGGYSLGAHASLRRAAAGLVISAVADPERPAQACPSSPSWVSGWSACSSAPAGSPQRWLKPTRH